MGFINGSIASAADPQAPALSSSDGSGSNPRVMPMQSIMQSIMRGNAETQAQAQVKDVAGKQANATKQLSVTMTANPDDPGNPLLHIKNATADIINQTQRSDLQKTYDTPHQNVDDAIAKMNAPRQSPGDFENTALASAGYQPYRTDRTAADLQTFSQDYRAQRELGEPVMKAAIKAGLMKLGAFDRDRVATALDRESFAKNAAAYKEIAPAIREEDYQSRSNRSEATLANTMAHQSDVENRLLQTQSDNEKKAVYSRHNAINKGIDYSQIDPGSNNEGWHKAFDDQNDTGVAATPQEYAAIDRKGAQDVNKAFLDYTDTKKDTFALGNQPTWEAAKAAFGHPLTAAQDAMGKARWQAAHTYAVRKAADDASMQEARAAKLEHLQYLNEHQGDVKPVSLDDSFVKSVPASDLLGVLGAVKNPDLVLQRKEALLTNEIQDRSDKLRKAQQDTKALNAMPTTARRFQWPVDVANAQADAQTHADRITAAQSELQQIQAARAARKSGAVAPVVKPSSPRPTNPTKGQTWQGPTGVQTFDGRGWVQ